MEIALAKKFKWEGGSFLYELLEWITVPALRAQKNQFKGGYKGLAVKGGNIYGAEWNSTWWKASTFR